MNPSLQVLAHDSVSHVVESDAGLFLIAILILLMGIFVGHRWATESRRLDDYIAHIEDEAPDPDLIPWQRHNTTHSPHSPHTETNGREGW